MKRKGIPRAATVCRHTPERKIVLRMFVVAMGLGFTVAGMQAHAKTVAFMRCIVRANIQAAEACVVTRLFAAAISGAGKIVGTHRTE